jgi:hypothetical protein
MRLYTHRFDGERGGGEVDCAAGLLLCRLRVPSFALIGSTDWLFFGHFKSSYGTLVISAITIPESECKTDKS